MADKDPKEYLDLIGLKEYSTKLKLYIDSKLEGQSSTDTYELVLNDDGSLQCVKNSTDEGFLLNEDGSL